jgi:hypothetical protein
MTRSRYNSRRSRGIQMSLPTCHVADAALAGLLLASLGELWVGPFAHLRYLSNKRDDLPDRGVIEIEWRLQIRRTRPLSCQR